MTLEQARERARVIARQITAKEISAYDGATRIWKEICDKLDVKCPDELWPFKSNASAIEDCRWNSEHGGCKSDKLINQCEQEILEAAKKLIEAAA